jgi:hypothetical protein
VEVTFETTVNDHVAFNLHMLGKAKPARLSYFLGWALLPSLLLVIAALAAVALRGWVAAAVCVVLAVGFAGSYPGAYRRRVRSSIRSFLRGVGTPGDFGPTTLTLSDESLVVTVGPKRTEVRWADIVGVDETPDHTFIRLTGLTAVIVPRLEFEADKDYFRVRDFAVTKAGRHHDQH